MEDCHEFDNNLDYRLTPCLEKANPGTGSIADFVERRVLSLALDKLAMAVPH